MTIGDKIKKYRTEQKLSQQRLGELLGVSQAMIAQYENGDRNPKIETRQKIANALNVNVLNFMESSEIINLIDIIMEKATNEEDINTAADLLDAAEERYKETYDLQTRLNASFEILNHMGQEMAVEFVEKLSKTDVYTDYDEVNRIVNEKTKNNS